MIVNRQRRVPVAIRPLQQFYERARSELGFAPESVTIQLISDEAMAELNETFRKKQGPTDVLSFPQMAPAPPRTPNMPGTLPYLLKRHAATRVVFRVLCPRRCAS